MNVIPGMMDIKLIPHKSWNGCKIPAGPLKLPNDVSVDGDLILIGENDEYMHCIISGSGAYYGVFKSHEENHLYKQICELNNNQ